MPLKRIYVDGAIYFVTSRTYNHKRIFINDAVCRLFLEVLDYCHNKLKFRLYAYNVLPTHVHALILPNSRNTISDVKRHIKGRFANHYKRLIFNDRSLAEDKFFCYGGKYARSPVSENHKGSITATAPVGEEFILASEISGPIWQKSFYDRIIRSDEHLHETTQYINHNAVKHQIVDDPIKWPYSSFHNHYNNKGIIKIDHPEGF